MSTPFRPLAALVILASAGPAHGAVRARTVEYRQGETVLEGYVAYDDAPAAKRPGVLVVHEWTGINPYTRRRVDQLAALGYVAFAADVYGKGVRPATPKEAAALAGRYKADRALLRARLQAALAELRRQPGVDPAKIAAIGYCFGGTGALELARSGADLLGVVSFHGGLDTPTPGDAKNIKAKVLALHGADDPFVTEAAVKGFEDEMRAAKVDWQLVKYSGAVHGFTNPDNGADTSKGAAYDADADRRSWIAMKDFFDELFR
ncbi:MAG TPA: dienelactone hydrolase family protein [Anaeromyxobacteraceae bacterium]|nr:dienelactone hydrolase family protein [Anaeromyxobacteraceae bacterium]